MTRELRALLFRIWTCKSVRVFTVRRLLDVLEEEMRDPLIVGVDEWDMERAEAPVIATGCKY